MLIPYLTWLSQYIELQEFIFPLSLMIKGLYRMYKEIIKECGCLWVGVWVNVDACKMSRSFSWLMAQNRYLGLVGTGGG